MSHHPKIESVHDIQPNLPQKKIASKRKGGEGEESIQNKKVKHPEQCGKKVNSKNNIALEDAKQKVEEKEIKQLEKLLRKQEIEARKEEMLAKKLERKQRMQQRKLEKEIENKAKEKRKIERERLRLEKKEQAEEQKRLKKIEKEREKQNKQMILELNAKFEKERLLQEAEEEKAATLESEKTSECYNAKETESDNKSNYEDLLAALDSNLVLNVEPFECPICFINIDRGEGVILHDCLHSFCKDCLSGSIQHSDTGLIKCPFQDEEYACDFFLQDREIKNLVSPEVYEKHLQKSLMLAESQAPNSFHCKTSDCPGWCLYEDNVNIFQCPACTRWNCLTCAAIHEGQNCKQYQDFAELNSATNEDAKATNLYLQSMLDKEEAMKCPKCFIIIMKKDGCDAITCSMCQTEICWVTKGARWGPLGRGDVSGGCRCNFNGQRCHPKCRNCH